MIKITHNLCKIDDGSNVYEDTHDNLLTHSGGLFTGLPSTIRDYQRRDSGVEYWVDVSDPDTPKQTSPDPSFVSDMDAVFADLENIIATKDAATSTDYTVLNVPDVQDVGQGDIIPFIIQWNVVLDENSEAVFLIEQTPEFSILHIFPITETPQTIEMEFEQIDAYKIIPQGINQTDEFIIRVVNNA